MRGDQLVLVESRALGRHDAEQRHAPRRRRLRAQHAAAPATSRGFKLRRHGLVPLSGATQPLSSATAGAVQVSFTPARRPARRLGEGRQHDRDLPRRPLGPRRSRHRARLGGRGAVRLLVRQARLAARHRGRRERAHLLPARPVRADHGLAPERPGRGLLGRLDEQRPLSSTRPNAATDSISAYSVGVERHALAASPRAARRPSWRPARTRSTRRSRMTASSTSTAATPAQINAFKIAGNGSLTSLGASAPCPPASAGSSSAPDASGQVAHAACATWPLRSAARTSRARPRTSRARATERRRCRARRARRTARGSPASRGAGPRCRCSPSVFATAIACARR